MKKHIGSSFESFLEEKGIKDDVELGAQKEILAEQIREAMERSEGDALGRSVARGDHRVSGLACGLTARETCICAPSFQCARQYNRRVRR